MQVYEPTEDIDIRDSTNDKSSNDISVQTSETERTFAVVISARKPFSARVVAYS